MYLINNRFMYFIENRFMYHKDNRFLENISLCTFKWRKTTRKITFPLRYRTATVFDLILKRCEGD